MQKKEYLTEENYHNTNQKVKKIGTILIVIGLILAGLGIFLVLGGFLGFSGQIFNGIENGGQGINGSSMFTGFGSFAIGGFLIGPGVMCTFIGFIMRFVIGNRREIMAYTTQQVMPVAQEGIEKMAPTIGKAGASIAKEMAPVYGSIAKEISKGIKEGLKDENNK